MSIPVDVTFRGMDPSAALRTLIEEQVEKLERFRDDMVACHVVVEQPKHRERGNPYHVTIHLSVPGEDIVVNHEPQLETSLRQTGAEERVKSTEAGMRARDPNLAVTEAFKRARRRMEDHLRKRRGRVKTHVEPPRGRIIRLAADKEYGFIQSEDGREIYFHRNSILNADPDSLEPGVTVSFAEESGDQGPQASSVRILA